MKLRSISTKITLLFVGALLLNGALIIFINLYQTSSMYTNEYDQEIQEIAANFRMNQEKMAREVQMTLDFNRLSSYDVHLKLASENELDPAIVSTENLKTLRSTPNQTVMIQQNKTNFIAALFQLPDSSLIQMESPAIEPVKPLMDELIIMKQIPLLNERSTPVLKYSIVGVLVLSVPMLLFLFFVLRRYTKPIVEMSAISEHFAEGDFDRQVNVKSNDEIGQLALSLNQMAVRLKAKEEARDAFLAAVSHELRTPLTTLKANSSGIAEGIIQADELSLYVESNIEEIDRLIRMVNDLILVSTLEQDLTLHVERSSINELVDSVVHSMRLLAQKKQVEFQVAAECEVDVLMDKSKMKQVLINVLHNAIQHSPENSAITVELKRSSSGVNIMIRDEGKGFSEEQLAHLFERFYRDQQSTGLGLGLYISRRIVLAHQGILTAWNDPSCGACVQMMLPEK